MRDEHYTTKPGQRISDEEWERFKENRRKLNFSWNLFIKHINNLLEGEEKQ